MGFSIVDKSSLPVVQIGRVAPTTPRVGITEVGSIVFNSFMTKQMAKDQVDRVLLLHDPESRKVAIIPAKKGSPVVVGKTTVDEKKLFTLSYATKTVDGAKVQDDTQSSIRGAQGWLRLIEYDFKASGSQMFDVEQADKPAKGSYLLTIPKGSLTPRPKQARTPRAEKVETVNGANGAVKAPAAVVAPPSDDELVLEA